MTKISIIVPCYNVEKLVGRCLDSLLEQTLPDIEIICIDDKSTDNTLGILKQYADADKRVSIIEMPENRGVAVARNMGLAAAKSPYIGFIDPDDWVDADFYEKLYAAIAKSGADVAKATVKITNMQNKKSYIDDLNERIKQNRLVWTYQFWSGLYNHDFLSKNNINFPDEVITGQDSVFLTHVTLCTDNIVLVNDTYYHYFLLNDGSLDSEFLSRRKSQSKLDMIKHKLRLIHNANLTDEQKTEFIKYQVIPNICYEIKKRFRYKPHKRQMFDMLYQYNKNPEYQDIIRPGLGRRLYEELGQNKMFKHKSEKLFHKERMPDGRRNIYVLGKRVWSYRKKLQKKDSIYAANKSLNYKTYNDLAYDIKSNIHKIPDNVDLVVGIPRSGMIPAYIIGLALNRKVCSVQEFLAGSTGNNGYTRYVQDRIVKNVLIVDDTVNSGMSVQKIKELLKPVADKFNLCFMAVYVANEKSAQFVDVYVKQLSQPRIFQWNYMYHNITADACYDMDGVLCVDPTDEENDDGEKYLNFIKNAKPLYLPNQEIGYIVTSRLEKYRAETEQWLKKHGVKYKKLYMLDCTAEERRKYGLHAKYKAKIYGQIKNSGLFIESNPEQAMEIANLTGKRCICCTNDAMYEIKK